MSTVTPEASDVVVVMLSFSISAIIVYDLNCHVCAVGVFLVFCDGRESLDKSVHGKGARQRTPTAPYNHRTAQK